MENSKYLPFGTSNLLPPGFEMKLAFSEDFPGFTRSLKTLEEVLNHYSSGGHPAPNVDPNIRSFPLSEQDKSDLVAFLKMLSDTAFIQNPAFASPFR